MQTLTRDLLCRENAALRHCRRIATISADDIVGWARGAMASYKAPRAVVFVDELPRTASNKINWRLLQDAEWGRTA